MLLEAQAGHNGVKGYLDRPRELIDRFLPTNSRLQLRYQELIVGVLRGSGPVGAL